MAALSAENRDTEAAAEADRAFAEWEERQRLETQKGIALLEAGLRADILRRDPASAARRIARKLALESPDPTRRFAALRAEQDDWYVRGRDKGLNFDLEVSIDLARIAHDHARDPDERGAALNDLAVSLWTLGARESGTARLEQAVAAYRAALEEMTRARVPLDWAMTQMNLGTALQTLGARESGTARLEEAVAAYRAALEERTRERVPLDWATTQMNLGNALQTLGERESGTARLEEAVAAYRAALEETDPRARAARLGDDADEPRHRAPDARGARERHGAAGAGGRRLPRRAGGEDPRARAARLGDDADEPRQRAPDARGAGERHGAAGAGGRRLPRRAGGADPRRACRSTGRRRR